MLTDAGDITKIEGALQKCLDAREKMCAVRLSIHTSIPDVATIIQCIDQYGAMTQHLSSILPPGP